MFCFCVAVGVDGGGIGGGVNDKTGVPDISMVTLVDFKRSHGRSWLTDNWRKLDINMDHIPTWIILWTTWYHKEKVM
jgi:hypothetical protein